MRFIFLGLCVFLTLWQGHQGLSRQEEDDIVFDDVQSEGTPVLVNDQQQQQDQLSKPTKYSSKNPKKWQPVEKLLGLPDAIATEGHVFKLKIHKQAFAGSVNYYEVKKNSQKASTLPKISER